MLLVHQNNKKEEKKAEEPLLSDVLLFCCSEKTRGAVQEGCSAVLLFREDKRWEDNRKEEGCRSAVQEGCSAVQRRAAVLTTNNFLFQRRKETPN